MYMYLEQNMNHQSLHNFLPLGNNYLSLPTKNCIMYIYL